MCNGQLFALIAYSIVFIFSAIADANALYVIVALSAIHAFTDPRAILQWIRFVARISIFLIVLVAVGMLFNQPFPQQMLLILRIMLFLLISAMLTRLITLDGLYRSVSGVASRRMRDFFFYLFCTLMFIPILFSEYDNLRKQDGKRSLQTYLKRLENVFHNAINRGDEVAKQAHEAMKSDQERVLQQNGAKLLLLFFYSAAVVIVSMFV